jgi:uncharacterized protein YciI
MRHFVVTITFLSPFESFGEAVGRHGAFLTEGYDAGLLLVSGPRTSKTGGIVVARAESEAALRTYMDRDPFKLEGLADYEIAEFSPTMSVPILASWVA